MKANKRKMAIVRLNVVSIILSSIALSKSIISKRKAKKEVTKEEPSHPLAPPFNFHTEFHTDGGIEFIDSFEDNLEDDEAKEEFEFHMEDNKEIDTSVKDLNLTIKASTKNGFNEKYIDILQKLIVDFKKDEPTYCKLAVPVVSKDGNGKRILFGLSIYKAYTMLSLLAMGMRPMITFELDKKSICRVMIIDVERQEMEWGSSYIFRLGTYLSDKEYEHLRGINVSSSIDEFYLGKEEGK